MFWVAQVVIVSFVIIFLLHNLYHFFKETLTIPKMKDMVKRPQQKYDALFRELSMHHDESKMSSGANDDANDANASMKNELKRYLMELNAPPQQQPPQQQPPQQQPLNQLQSHHFQSNFTELGSVY